MIEQSGGQFRIQIDPRILQHRSKVVGGIAEDADLSLGRRRRLCRIRGGAAGQLGHVL
jgi:hypothetical protein